MKTTEQQIIEAVAEEEAAKIRAREVELEAKRKEWRGVNKAIDLVLSPQESSLYQGLIKDFTSNTPRLSISSFFNVAKFIFQHPVRSFNLLKMVIKGTYADPDFQKNLLANDKLWSFVQKTSKSLPEIGKMLDKFGIKVFQENGILDQKALEILKNSLGEKGAIEAVKNIVIATMSPTPDWTKVTSEALSLLANNESFKRYFAEKGSNIRDYVKDLVETTPMIKESLATYKVDLKFLDQLPAILNNFPQLQKVWDDMQNKGVMNGVETALDMLANDESLNLFFKENPSFLPDIAKGYIQNNRELAEIKSKEEGVSDQDKADARWLSDTLGSYNFDEQILNIVGKLASSPILVKELVADYNKGDYMQLTDGLIVALGNAELGLAAELQQQARAGLFDKLIAGVLLQNEKSLAGQGEDAPKSLRASLEDFGIAEADLPEITKIFPILLDRPKDLHKVFTKFREGDYVGMSQDLIALSTNNEGVKHYMDDNRELFDKILKKSIGVPDLFQADSLSSEKAEGQKTASITGIFQILMNSENQTQMGQLLDLYKKGEMIGLIKETCRFMETDPVFSEYLNANKENFALIINAVVDQTPAIKTWTKGAQLGSFVSSILKDPKSIRIMIEGWEGGTVAITKAAATVFVAKALDPEFRSAFGGAILGIAKGWMVGGGADKQGLVDGLLQAVSSRENPEVQLKLSKFLQEGIAQEGASFDQKLIELLAKKTLFDDVSIHGKSDEPLNLGNLKIQGTSFTNSVFFDVSFANTKFEGVSFNNATFSNVSFAGSSIDAATLATMLPQLKKSATMLASDQVGRESYAIDLTGVKIIGDLSGMDLSGVSLKGADLSGVTSMQDADLNGADLTDATLDSKLLIETFNLGKAKRATIKGIIIAQKERLLNKILQSVADKRPTQEVNSRLALEAALKILVESESQFGEHVREMLESRPSDIMSGNFPEIPENLKHASSSRGKTSRLLTLLYNHRDNPEGLPLAIAAQIMADDVSKKLFGEGNNRGYDAAMIEQTMQKVMERFSQDNPDVDLRTLSESEKGRELVNVVAKDLTSKAKYTSAGLVSGGIFLPKEIFNEGLVHRLTAKMNNQYQLNSEELKAISAISDTISRNLFGAGKDGARKDDAGYIDASLKEVFAQIKREKGGADLSKALEEKTVEIAGESKANWLSTTRTALTEVFYNNASYTTAGLSTGGIYIKEEIAQGLVPLIKEAMDKQVGAFVAQLTRPSVGPAIDSRILEEAKIAAQSIGNIREGGSSYKPGAVVKSPENGKLRS